MLKARENSPSRCELFAITSETGNNLVVGVWKRKVVGESVYRWCLRPARACTRNDFHGRNFARGEIRS